MEHAGRIKQYVDSLLIKDDSVHSPWLCATSMVDVRLSLNESLNLFKGDNIAAIREIWKRKVLISRLHNASSNNYNVVRKQQTAYSLVWSFDIVQKIDMNGNRDAEK